MGFAARSLLFVPADSERKYRRAGTSQAHALILDLEDSVEAARKGAARDGLVDLLAGRPPGRPVFVRINALATGLALDDLHAAVRAGADGIMLPKCQSADAVRIVAAQLDGLETALGRPLGATSLLPIATETAASLFTLGQYAGCSPRLAGLVWGAEDLAADFGATEKRGPGGYHGPYRMARDLCLAGATAAAVAAIDTVWVDLTDRAGLEAEARAARRDGFAAKLLIHPDQAEVVNAAFAPSERERQWARVVIDAFLANPGAGVLTLDGIMIDRPHLRLAERLLAGG